MHLIENFLRQLQIASEPISIASHEKYSKTIRNCDLAKFQLHLIEKFPRQFHIVS